MTESQWPVLAESLKRFGIEQNLEFFDTSLKLDYAHVLGLSVCSPKGLQIHASDDVWKADPRADGDPDHTTVFLYAFKNFDSRAIGEALVVLLESRHPGATVQRNSTSEPNESLEHTRGE